MYAGGQFQNAGATNVHSIAQWNGTSWSPLARGLDNQVSALAASGNTLYAMGSFDFTSDNAVALRRIASITLAAAFGFTNGMFGFNFSGPEGSNVVIDYSTDLTTWIPLQTNLLGNSPLYFSDPQSTASQQRFYRARLLP